MQQGQASLSETGNTLTIDQGSDKVSIHYDAFDIGLNEQVIFNQPSASSVALNRVIGGSASEILGRMQSNGQVFLINPNGIVFGADAQIDVGSLLASTLNISDEDFFEGNYQFSAQTNAALLNEGLIQAARNGYVALLSAEITNKGEIHAPEGVVLLEAADQVLLELSDQAVSIVADAEMLDALIENQGLIEAEGGLILLNANARDALHQSVINNSGVIRATSMIEHDGEIILGGHQGDIFNEGAIDVSAAGDEVNAGRIHIEANRISQSGNLLATGRGNGDGGQISVTANEAILITRGQSDASGGLHGDGGELIYFADGATLFTETASLSARGGGESGDGGFIEVSGLDFVAVEGEVDASASNGAAGTFLIDPTNIEITNVQNNGIFSAIVGGFEWFPSGGTPSQVDAGTLSGLLAGGNNIVVDTARVDTGVETGTLTVNADINLDGGGGQTLSLIADDNLTINANICEGGAACSYTDDDVNLIFTSGGTFTVADGVQVNSGAGTINISATVGATVTGLESRSTSANAITVLTSGSISDGGNTNPDINIAPTGTPLGGVALTANNGITLSDMRATQADISNNLAGNVSLGGSLAIEFTDIDVVGDFSVTKGNGDVTIGGFTQAQNVAINTGNGIVINDGVLVDVGTNTIDLTAGGDITVTGLVTSNTGASGVSLDAGGQILDGGNTNTDIDAPDARVQLVADNGIIDIETRVNNIDIDNSTSGTVSINETNNLGIFGFRSVGDATITTASVSDITFNSDVDLEGADGATYTFNSAGGIQINSNICEGGAACSFVDDSVALSFISAGDMTVSDGSTVDSGNSLLSINAGGNAQLTGLVSRNIADNAVDITATTITDSDADLLDVDVTTANGGVTLTSTGDTNDFVISSATATLTSGAAGNFNITSEADLDLKDLNTTGTLVLVARSADTNVSGYTSASGFTISSNQAISIDDGVLIDVGAGQIGLQTTSGNITATGLRTTNAGADAILINTGNGQILDGGDTSLDADVTNGDLDLFASLGISDLEIDAATATVQNITSGAVTLHQAAGEAIDLTTLSAAGDFSLDGTANITLSDAAHSVGGNLNLNASSTGDLIVPDAGLSATGNLILAGNDLVDSDDTVSISGGQLVLSLNAPTNPKIFNTTLTDLSLAIGNSQNATVNEANNLNLAGIAMGGGDAVINTLAGGNLIVTGGIDLDGWNGGSLTLDADNDLQITSNQDILDSATGSLDLVDLNFTAGNEVFVQINNEIFSYGGDITISAGGDFDTRNASDYNSGTGKISVTAGDVSLISYMQSDNAASDAITIISGDQIVDGGGANLDVQAANGGTILQAVNGINLDTNVVDLSATNTGTGDIVVDEANDLNITGLSFSGGNATLTTQGGGDITLASDIDLNGANGGTLTLNAANDISFNVNLCDGGVTCSATPDDVVNISLNAGNDLTINTGADIDSGGGNIDLIAGNTWFKFGGTTLDSGLGTINIQGNSVELRGGANSDNTSASAITVTSTTNIQDGGGAGLDLEASGGGITLNAATGINLDIDAAQLAVINSTSGSVVIDEDNTVDLTALSFAGGDVMITTLNAGDLIASGTLELDGANGQTLNLIAANDLIFNTGGQVLDTNTGTLDVVAVNLTAGNNMTFASNTDVDSYGGDIVLVATGNYLSNSGADIRADTGTLSLNANNVQLIGSLRSNSVLANAVSVSSANQIVDGGAANVDIDARNGGVVLNAVNGIDLDTQVSGLDATNTGTGAISIAETDDIEVTNLSSVGDFNLSSGGVVTLPNAGLNLGANNLNLSATDFVDAAGREIDLSAATLTLNTQTAGGDSTFNLAVTNLDLTNGGTNRVIVYDDNLNLTNLSANADTSISLLGALTIPDAGINIGTNELILVGTDIQDVSGRTIDLSAGDLTVWVTAPVADAVLNTSASSLNLRNLSANQVTLNETDALTLVDWDNSGDSVINVGGILTIPDAGLSSGANNLVITAADLIDVSGRDVNLTANQLSVDLASPFADLSFNTSVNDLQVHLGSPAGLIVNETDALNLSDVAGLGSAIDLAQGDLVLASGDLNVDSSIQVADGSVQLRSNGDMAVNSTIVASDISADGLRSALIDLQVNGGNFSLGASGSASLISNNLVDQNANGGLGTEPSNQVSIRVAQIDSSNTTQNFSFGDNAGSDVTLRAVGGDVYVDSVGGASLVGQTRNVTLNSDVSIEAYNVLSDASDGSVTSADLVDNGAALVARTGRAIQINQPAPVVTTPVPEVDGDELDRVVEDTVSDSGESSGPAEESITQQVESDRKQVANVYGAAFGNQCSEANLSAESEADCRVEQSLVGFLGTFLIGGELPGAATLSP